MITLLHEWRTHSLAHEGLAIIFVIIGVILILGYLFGPMKEVREIKRKEGFIMLIPSAIILFAIAIVVFSGVLG